MSKRKYGYISEVEVTFTNGHTEIYNAMYAGSIEDARSTAAFNLLDARITAREIGERIAVYSIKIINS